jgi:hypothetical protein
MSGQRDWEEEMKRNSIDEPTAERMLAGLLSPDDAPPGYAGVARMFQAAAGPAEGTELESAPVVVTSAVAALRAIPAVPTASPRRNPMRTRMLSAKVAALAATAVLAATGVAAAATGNLPEGVQTSVSDTAAHVGISVPKPHTDAVGNGPGAGAESQASDQSPTHTTATPDKAGHSDFGRCTAFLAAPNSHANSRATAKTHSGKYGSTAFSSLIAAHGGTTAATTAYCTGVVAAGPGKSTEPTEATEPTEPNETTASTGTTEPADHGKSADHGKPATAGSSGSHAPVSTPNGGATDTANTASSGDSAHGTDTANGSGNRGSSNADSHNGSGSGSGTSHRP